MNDANDPYIDIMFLYGLCMVSCNAIFVFGAYNGPCNHDSNKLIMNDYVQNCS